NFWCLVKCLAQIPRVRPVLPVDNLGANRVDSRVTEVAATKDFWQTCVQRLEQDLPPQQLSAWIRPLVPLAFDETQAALRVSAPNRFKLDWVRKNFSHKIETLATEWYERPVQVSFELAGGAARPAAATRPASA